MSSINPKENRDVIPNWRSYKRTAQLGELYTRSLSIVKLPVFQITPYVEAWNEDKSIAFAGDLISAAILNGQTALPEVLEAATSVICQPDAPKLIVDIARTIVPSPNNYNSKYSNSPSVVLDEIEKKKERAKKIIKIIKQENTRFPYNPIAYCELARFYISLGLSKKARNAMEVALHLAPYSRYVSRCAARLYVHLGEFDLAHRVVVYNQSFQQDPWLIASEIAINSTMGRSSRFVNIGKSIIASNNYSPFSCAELASAIGTLEMANGSRKKCLKFINQALIQPNDNSLAQAEWLTAENSDLKFNFLDYSNLEYKAEADARFSYLRNDYQNAFRYSVDWVEDFPYDRSSILFSSHIAYVFLKEYDSASRILKIGLLANPNDDLILNNLAYVYALSGKIDSAEKMMERVASIQSGVSEESKICHIATNGLIQFRKGNIETGRELYIKAITSAKEQIKDRRLINKAILNYLREELVAQTCSTSDVLDILSKLDIGQDKEMVQLRDDVLDEVKRYSKSLTVNPIKFDVNSF